MAEVELENHKCPECNSAVRPGSLFCFHCGAAIPVKSKNKANVSDAWFRESIVEGQDSAVVAAKPKSRKAVAVVKEKSIEMPIEEPIAEPIAEPIVETATETEEAPTEMEETTVAVEEVKVPDSDIEKLKSASSIRTRPKTVKKKTVEVIWEEPENSPNLWFILSAIFFVAIAAAIMVAAWYLR